MNKVILPLALAVTLCGAVVAPAPVEAQTRWERRSDWSNSEKRRELLERADNIQDRARRLRREGRLSQDHYQRTLDKISRVRSFARSQSRISDREINTQMRYLEQVGETLGEWARDGRDGRDDRDFRNRRWR